VQSQISLNQMETESNPGRSFLGEKWEWNQVNDINPEATADPKSGIKRDQETEMSFSETTDLNVPCLNTPEKVSIEKQRATMIEIKAPSVYTAVTVQRTSMQKDHSKDFVGNPMAQFDHENPSYGDYGVGNYYSAQPAPELYQPGYAPNSNYEPYDQGEYLQGDQQKNYYEPVGAYNLYPPYKGNIPEDASFQSALSKEHFNTPGNDQINPVDFRNSTPTNSQNHTAIDETQEINQQDRLSYPVGHNIPIRSEKELHETYIAHVPEEPKEKKAGRRYCCCFRTCWGCCLVFLLVLLAIAAALYFIFPQIPTVDVSEPYIPTGSAGVLINGQSVDSIDQGTLLNSGKLTLSLNLALNVSFYSPSYINFGISTLEVHLQPKQQDGSLLQNFVGIGRQKNLRFPARTTTDFIVPVTLEYTVTFTSVLALFGDPAIRLFTQTCLQKQKFPAQLQVRLEVAAISWTGYWPEYTWDRELPCPDSSAINELIRRFSP
jgi:hypothetical protein